MRDTMDYIKECCKRAVYSIPEGDWDSLAGELASRKRVFVFGAGRSGLVGQLFAVRLVQIGLQVHFIGDMTTPIIDKGDLVLLISNTGNTMSVFTTAEIAKRREAFVMAVTSDPDSRLANVSDRTIVIKACKDPEAARLAPLGTIFEDSVIFFFDCLVPELMRRRGVTEEDMRRRHAIWV